MAAKEVKSHLTTRLCLALVWETEKPFLDRPRESPAFRFANHDWCLRLVYDERSPATYDVYAVNRGVEAVTDTFPPFSVTVHFENPRKGGETHFSQKRSVSRLGDYLWTVNKDEFLRVVPDLEVYADFTLVFMFQASDESAEVLGKNHVFKAILGEKSCGEHKAVQASFDPPLSWKVHLDKSNESWSASLDLPFSLDCLSEDLANMLEKNIFPDVQLKIGDRVVPAHRAVLAARSEVFAAMFRNDMSESNSGIVNIEDIDAHAVDAFLGYLYSGKISGTDLTEDLVPKLYAASDKYAVYALKNICSKHMIRNVNRDNFVEFLCLADSHSDGDFKNAIISIVTEDDSWLKSATWLRFAPENVTLANEVFCKYFSK